MAERARTVDPQRMLDTATAFFLAGERNKLLLRSDKYDFHSLDAPTITNFGLSVEIALKLLVYLQTGELAVGHSIADLFGKVSKEARERMYETVEFSNENTNYFVDWRYPYEKDFLIGSVDTPRRAFIECYREIRLALPNLKSVYEENWGVFEPDWVETPISHHPRFEIISVTDDD